MASEAPWKQFLALRGVLQQIADLMTKEIEQLHKLEETTLTSDLAQGIYYMYINSSILLLINYFLLNSTHTDYKFNMTDDGSHLVCQFEFAILVT